MKHFRFLAALLCLLATANQVNAQLVIRDNGRVEIGTDPDNPAPPGLNPNYYNWLDTTTTLKVFGKDGPNAAGGHITFGDNLLINNYNAAVGELKNGDSDRLWLQGKLGTYITANAIATDTIMFFDYDRSSAVQFRKDVQTSGRTSGQVTVTGNIDYEIEHTGEVRFEGGFRVDKGVKFAVRPSTYDK